MDNAKPWYSIFLKSWQPVPTVGSTVLLFLVIGIAFIAFGIAMNIVNGNIVEVSKRYDDISECKGKANCTFTINVPETMSKPVFIFYELDNFYQNHRRYIKSKSNNQLAGEVISLSDAQSACSPVVTNRDMGKTVSWNNTALDPDAVASPCGLIAKSLFNDSYSISQNGNRLAIIDTGISWPSDKGNKFKKAPKSEETQWINPENEHFIVWMRTAGLPNFRKLYGRVESDLQAGDYTVDAVNNYDVASFEGKKSLVMSTSGPFGGKNRFLEIAYIVVGIICLIIAAIFFWKKKITNDKFGEPLKEQ